MNTRAVNDATLKKVGDIYQYLIALKDCFELNDGETLQIETNGDVSVINKNGGSFQREVKHHVGQRYILDRDIDFWKTLANWYVDYERVKNFSSYILSTTAKIKNSSPFYCWNEIKEEEKLNRLKAIGKKTKKNESTFRAQYSRIFNESYDENKLLRILGKFTIESEKTSISGISDDFSKYLRPIPKENRDGYIGALLGRIVKKIDEPPYKWEVSKEEFDEFCQIENAAYGVKGSISLPQEYATVIISDEESRKLENKTFVNKIREIEYSCEIANAISDYWKTDMTVAKYFCDNCMYLESLENYRNELNTKLCYGKRVVERKARGNSLCEQIDKSKEFYDSVMMWDANDFGSIIRNQGFFQRGVIHNIVEDTDFRWKVGEEKDEHK